MVTSITLKCDGFAKPLILVKGKGTVKYDSLEDTILKGVV